MYPYVEWNSGLTSENPNATAPAIEKNTSYKPKDNAVKSEDLQHSKNSREGKTCMQNAKQVVSKRQPKDQLTLPVREKADKPRMKPTKPKLLAR